MSDVLYWLDIDDSFGKYDLIIIKIGEG